LTTASKDEKKKHFQHSEKNAKEEQPEQEAERLSHWVQKIVPTFQTQQRSKDPLRYLVAN
jgi:hypothetical protein